MMDFFLFKGKYERTKKGAKCKITKKKERKIRKLNREPMTITIKHNKPAVEDSNTRC